MYRENTIIPKSFYSIDEKGNNLHSHIIDLGNKKQTKTKPTYVPFTALEKKIISMIEEDEENSISLYDQIPGSSDSENDSFSSLEEIDDKNEKPNLEKSKYISNFVKEPTKAIASKKTEKKYNLEITEKKNLNKKNNNQSDINQTKASISDFSEKNQNKKTKSKIDISNNDLGSFLLIDDNKNKMFNNNVNGRNENGKIVYNNISNTIISGTKFTLFNNQNKVWTNKKESSLCIIGHEDEEENELENSNEYKILDLSPAKPGFDENLSKKRKKSNNKKKSKDKRKKSNKNKKEKINSMNKNKLNYDFEEIKYESFLNKKRNNDSKKKKTKKNSNNQNLLKRKKIISDEFSEEMDDYGSKKM